MTLSGMVSSRGGALRNGRALLGAVSALAAMLFVNASPASANLVSGWGLETGAQAGALTDGVPGSFEIADVTGNAVPRALFPGIDFSDVGDIVRLRGFATFANPLGNVQFRFGLYDTDGADTGTLSGGEWSGATPSGWKGYFASPGNDGGADVLIALDGGAYFSLFGGNVEIGSFPSTSDAAGDVEYEFSLTLTRLSASDIQVDYSFVGGDENRSGSAIDSGGDSTSLTTLNAVGFLTNTNTGASSFRDVEVFFIPEPSSLLITTIALAVVGLMGPRRRRCLIR